MNRTKIEWTDFTSNPLKFRNAQGRIVWGCVKTSPGCAHCYAETLAKRYQGGQFTSQRMAELTPFMDDRELRAFLNKTALPSCSKVFVGDMTDVFGEWVTDEMLDRLFVFMALRPDVVFQVLTKRAERMAEYVLGADGREFKVDVPGLPLDREPFDWPLPNVWLGVSVENPEYTKRIYDLLRTPAAVRFLSLEPLLWEISLAPWFDPTGISCGAPGDVDCQCPGCRHVRNFPRDEHGFASLDWVIVGGESGPSARPFDLVWARALRDQCKAAGVPFFFKQAGSRPIDLDRAQRICGNEKLPFGTEAEKRFAALKLGALFDAAAVRLLDRKGGNLAELPEDLRVRQFPEVRR